MKIKNILKNCVIASFLYSNLLLAAPIDYSIGSKWHRSLDWVPGSNVGTSIGNAAPDSAGNAVWQYGVLTGDAIDSTNPWYKNTASKMVWDDEWWGRVPSSGVWARAYNGPSANNDGANPPIDRYGMIHDLSQVTHSYEYTSAIDWLNPVGNGAVVNISGSFSFTWQGQFQDNSPSAGLEAVIARYDLSIDDYQILWAGNYLNPTFGHALSDASKINVPVTLTGIRFDEGDFLRFTFRGLDGPSDTPLWLGAGDAFVIKLVSVVPEPQFYIMLLAGLVVLSIGIRREKRKVIAANLN